MLAVLGDVRDAGVDRLARVSAAQPLAPDEDLSAGRPAHAADRLGELALAVAGDARDGDDFARMYLEGRAANGGEAAVAVDPHVPELEHRLALATVAVSLDDVDVMADHQGGERPGRRLGGRNGVDVAAGTEDGDAVRHRHHLVQLVRDEDHRPPLGGDLAQRLEQAIGLLRRQHRGRLVEDQHTGVAVERLQDLDALLLTHGQLPDAGMRVDGQAVARPELVHLLFDAPGAHEEPPPFVGDVAEDDVLCDTERRDEPEVLVDHAHACVDRIPGRAEVHDLPGEADLALVGPVEAREDVRQRRLAGAVLTEQRVNLARRRLEVDVVVRDHPREPLDDSLELDGGRGGRRHGQPLTLPITPLTSQFMAYSCFTVMRWPCLIRSFPLWSYSGPANS